MNLFTGLRRLFGISKFEQRCKEEGLQLQAQRWAALAGHLVEYRIVEKSADVTTEHNWTVQRANFAYVTRVHRVERVEGTKIYFVGISEPVDIAQDHPEIRCVR